MKNDIKMALPFFIFIFLSTDASHLDFIIVTTGISLLDVKAGLSACTWRHFKVQTQSTTTLQLFRIYINFTDQRKHLIERNMLFAVFIDSESLKFGFYVYLNVLPLSL